MRVQTSHSDAFCATSSLGPLLEIYSLLSQYVHSFLSLLQMNTCTYSWSSPQPCRSKRSLSLHVFGCNHPKLVQVLPRLLQYDPVAFHVYVPVRLFENGWLQIEGRGSYQTLFPQYATMHQHRLLSVINDKC